MKTILMLTDFSENANHAAKTAAKVLRNLNADILLYNTYYDHPILPAYSGGPWVVEEFVFRKGITLAMWASEPIPFYPMEIALHDAYSKTGLAYERPDYRMIHEYPLGGKPPMMTRLFENGTGKRFIAAKGAPEALISISNLNSSEKKQIAGAIEVLAAEGYRVLTVGEANFPGSDFPATQQEFHFAFKGLVAFYNPPKKNINAVLQGFYKAGVAVKIITEDNAQTTGAIARQIDFRGDDQCISGDALMQLSEKELRDTVETVSIFTRMFPDAKLKIINALKYKNEIVAIGIKYLTSITYSHPILPI